MDGQKKPLACELALGRPDWWSAPGRCLGWTGSARWCCTGGARGELAHEGDLEGADEELEQADEEEQDEEELLEEAAWWRMAPRSSSSHWIHGSNMPAASSGFRLISAPTPEPHRLTPAHQSMWGLSGGLLGRMRTVRMSCQ